jgi:uncharacterized membrane protein
MSKPTPILTKQEEELVVQAIKNAEKNTSGEIRVHIESNNTQTTPRLRAEELFVSLGMTQTKESNGVLFYIDLMHNSFVILGDSGIDQIVGNTFWNSTKDLVIHHFANKEFCKGLCLGIEEAGIQLKKYFPYQQDDQNELPDTISKS